MRVAVGGMIYVRTHREDTGHGGAQTLLDVVDGVPHVADAEVEVEEEQRPGEEGAAAKT
jgi:hypothetical protein